MICSKKTEAYLSILLFITINVLFYFKYLSRLSIPFALIISVGYIVLTSILFIAYLKNKMFSWKPAFTVGAGLLYIIISSVILNFISKESLQVDRYLMIELFWDTVREGNYPYSAQSSFGNYPGPMPFYFILCYPFYVIGEIGYTALAGVAIWLFYIHKKYSSVEFNFSILLLIMAISIQWEVFARSTIFFNTCLFGLYFFSLKNYPFTNKRLFYVSAIIGGLLFSTRNVFAIPMVIWGIYLLSNRKVEFLHLFKWGLVFVTSFVISFLPFVLLNPSEFLQMNPFIIQSSFLMPFYLILFFIALSVIFGFFCKTFEDVVFSSGLLLFLTVTGHVIYVLLVRGITDGYLMGGADISYYIFCFPFLLQTMLKKQSHDQ